MASRGSTPLATSSSVRPCSVADSPTEASPSAPRRITWPAPPRMISSPSTGTQPMDSSRALLGSRPVVSTSTASQASSRVGAS